MWRNRLEPGESTSTNLVDLQMKEKEEISKKAFKGTVIRDFSGESISASSASVIQPADLKAARPN